MIIALRTDQPEAHIYLVKEGKVLSTYTWQAHRELSDTIFIKIQTVLESQQATLQDLIGIVVYQGPGSFTGLRIGITIANTLSYSLRVPVAAAEGEEWLSQSLKTLETKHFDSSIITPEYGSAPHITKPRK